MTIKGILFDKDGTLLDFNATWVPVYRAVARVVAGGDEALAAELLRAGGQDDAAEIVAPGSLLAAATTREIDVDTIEVEGERIRLHGIDAPESKQTCEWPGKTIPCGRLEGADMSAVEVLRMAQENGIRLGIRRDHFYRTTQGERFIRYPYQSLWLAASEDRRRCVWL